MLKSFFILLLGTAHIARAADAQVVFAPVSETPSTHEHNVDEAILAALKAHSDPVAALVSLKPESESLLTQPRLLRILGDDSEPQWMTEGDKLRLRRQGKKFVDITDHEDFYAEQMHTLTAGKPHLPELIHESLIRPLFPKIDQQRMTDVLHHMTGYYNRYYGDIHGELSSEWLHEHIAEIIAKSPFRTHISLEYFTHPFPQSSIIARFEPKVRNASAPLTILGAHQDSANYLFPLLPAPGADDDCSGTVSILEAFRLLAESGYTPQNGPVEFHWYAAEEGGLLGSQRVARYKKEQGANIGAMMEFDMTAFIARNATESIGFISTQADAALTNWTVKLSGKYISIPAKIYDLGPSAGSDYMSYTQLNYPAAFASEGNPLAGGFFPGEFDPYVHGTRDTMWVNDETGYFSVDGQHMARFTELAIAFVVEQAGWNNGWR
ncbi:peptidase family M28 [Penicillium verhagenii]|uniref:peptidase family M28 n=1 Tax=Penicillium verhagenii TaxID=1562060 RepID=UPI002544EA2A|nr:peptidase family M28 [Penicillium verhagenii]KAJ5930397.1 peptidase family M28 [Penicillium verhagenii]